ARRSGARVVKAAQIADAGDVRDLERFHVDFHLLDARPSRAQPQSLRGGTGETFDWSLARAHRSDVPLIVSGGLSAENVGEAIAGLLRDFAGRPTPLYRARRMSEQLGWPVYLKREDLNHTGSHKLNNALGQALLAKRMGKRRVIAETGAGQHGVATATACARFGLQCVVYMGEEDIRRQQPNVFSMRLLGAEVRPVSSGSRTLRDAINEAMRDWMASVETTHYIIGSVVGPHPFPMMVRNFQAVIGRETRQQCLDRLQRLPDNVVACVGGGS